jgi:hypothetical protein
MRRRLLLLTAPVIILLAGAAATADRTAEAAFQGLNQRNALGRNLDSTVPGANWIPVGSMAVSRAGSPTATTLLSGQVLVVGGNNSDPRAELYDPESRTFTRGWARVDTPCSAHGNPSPQREGANRRWAGRIRHRHRERRAL